MLAAASAGGGPTVGLCVVDPTLVAPAGEHRLGVLAGWLADLDDPGGGRLG